MPRQELRRDHGCEARRCRKLQARRREAAVCCERPTRSVHSQNSKASKPGCVQAAAAQVTTAMGARCTLIGMAASVRCRCCRAGPARSVGTGEGRTRDLSGEADRPDGAGLVGGSGEVVCKDRRPVRWRRRAAGRCLLACVPHRRLIIGRASIRRADELGSAALGCVSMSRASSGLWAHASANARAHARVGKGIYGAPQDDAAARSGPQLAHLRERPQCARVQARVPLLWLTHAGEQRGASGASEQEQRTPARGRAEATDGESAGRGAYRGGERREGVKPFPGRVGAQRLEVKLNVRAAPR